MSAIDLPARVRVPENVVFQILDGQAVLLDLHTERYFELDDVATRMWELLKADGVPATTVKTLLVEYDVDEPTLSRDLAGLIQHLLQRGLIETA